MHALQSFVDEMGCLPVAGVVPDMKAETEFYVKLQKVYKEKARTDMTKFKLYVDDLVKESGHSPIDQDLVERFCKFCFFIKIQHSNSLNVEYSSPIPPSIRSTQINIGNAITDTDSEVIFYCLIRAADRFKTLHSRFPGVQHELYGSDCLAFEALFSTFLKESNVEANNYQDSLKEM